MSLCVTVFVSIFCFCFMFHFFHLFYDYTYMLYVLNYIHYGVHVFCQYGIYYFTTNPIYYVCQYSIASHLRRELRMRSIFRNEHAQFDEVGVASPSSCKSVPYALLVHAQRRSSGHWQWFLSSYRELAIGNGVSVRRWAATDSLLPLHHTGSHHYVSNVASDRVHNLNQLMCGAATLIQISRACAK